jgi:hypothetical protein
MRFAGLSLVLVLVPNVGAADLESQRGDVRRCLEATAAAASSENLDAYIECFDPRLRSHIRKTAGLRFAQHDVGISIEDFHVLSGDEASCEVAVRYTLSLSDRSFDLLSVLTLKRVESDWKIRRETVRAWQESTVADSPFPYGGCSASTASSRPPCSSGSCSLTGR